MWFIVIKFGGGGGGWSQIKLITFGNELRTYDDSFGREREREGVGEGEERGRERWRGSEGEGEWVRERERGREREGERGRERGRRRERKGIEREREREREGERERERRRERVLWYGMIVLNLEMLLSNTPYRHFSYRLEQDLAPMSLHVLSCSLMFSHVLVGTMIQKGYHNMVSEASE